MTSFLSPEQLNFFEDNGYLIVENVIDPHTLDNLWREYDAQLNNAAAILIQQGKLSQSYAELPFGERYCAIMAEAPEAFQYLEICYPLENHNFPADAPIHCGPAVFDLLTHPRLLDVVESIIGPEISSNPVQHARLKPPYKQVNQAVAANSYIGKTTWHQDQGALLDEANESQVLTTWVAITDAPEERGCMVVIPGSHKKNELTVHCPGKGVTSENYIPSRLLGDDQGNKQVVTMPCKAGDIVILHQYTEHAALPNKTDMIRWSFDLRWNPIGHPSGRPAFPSFVARSRHNPESELRDHELWGDLWLTAKERILNGDYTGQIFNEDRWKQYTDAPVCA